MRYRCRRRRRRRRSRRRRRRRSLSRYTDARSVLVSRVRTPAVGPSCFPFPDLVTYGFGRKTTCSETTVLRVLPLRPPPTPPSPPPPPSLSAPRPIHAVCRRFAISKKFFVVVLVRGLIDIFSPGFRPVPCRPTLNLARRTFLVFTSGAPRHFRFPMTCEYARAMVRRRSSPLPLFYIPDGVLFALVPFIGVVGNCPKTDATTDISIFRSGNFFPLIFIQRVFSVYTFSVNGR